VTTDFDSLLAKWGSIFLKTVDPTREARMEAILSVLGTHFHAPIRVLDLGTGPGPFAGRILKRFGGSQVVGVDSDPVLLRVGERALSHYGSRITWILADLRQKDWSYGLPAETFDAAVSSLALHWLEAREIRVLYRELRRLLRPEGCLVNGDFLPSHRTKRGIRDPGVESDGDGRAETVEASVRAFKPKWERWWRALLRFDVSTVYQAITSGSSSPGT
jgi:SAM-dependent methyltransferase